MVAMTKVARYWNTRLMSTVTQTVEAGRNNGAIYTSTGGTRLNYES